MVSLTSFKIETKIFVYKMILNNMTIDQMITNIMTIHKIIIDQIAVGKMTISKVIISDISVDKQL
jgi:hypothetical protein